MEGFENEKECGSTKTFSGQIVCLLPISGVRVLVEMVYLSW